MPTLTVRRDSPKDSGFRQVHVFLDERPIGVLNPGDSVQEEIEPGKHALKVYNTLVTKSLEFEVAAGDSVAFMTGNQASGCLMAIAVSFGIGVMGVFLEPVKNA
ncbi:MAG: hypothetical protein HZC36_15410 [Armatimonadetes bacterium]|nr:hypothetical protein [Armatimonadota bacterium]